MRGIRGSDALTHQEAKPKEKEQANQSDLIKTNIFCHPRAPVQDLDLEINRGWGNWLVVGKSRVKLVAVGRLSVRRRAVKQLSRFRPGALSE